MYAVQMRVRAENILAESTSESLPPPSRDHFIRGQIKGGKPPQTPGCFSDGGAQPVEEELAGNSQTGPG